MKKIPSLLAVALLIGFQISAQSTFKLASKQWMIPDLSTFKLEPNDTLIFGNTVFVKKENVSKFIPKKWQLPRRQDLLDLVNALNGEPNTTGGKNLDSAYLQTQIPFTLNGIYFSSAKRLIGKGNMTAFYASDMLWKFDSTGLQPAQVMLHIYRQGKHLLNIEPSYNKLSRGFIYCQLLLMRTSKSGKRKETMQ